MAKMAKKVAVRRAKRKHSGDVIMVENKRARSNLMAIRQKPQLSLRNAVIGLPEGRWNRFVFVKEFSVTTSSIPGGGAAPFGAVTLIAANSVGIPYTSENTHQPMGLDQWSQFYTRYIVASSTCVVEFGGVHGVDNAAYRNQAAAGTAGSDIYASAGVMCTLSLADDGVSAQSLYTTEMEHGACKYVSMHQDGVERFSKLKAGFNTANWYGIKDIKDNLGTHGAAFTASPTNLANYQIRVCNRDTSTQLAHRMNFVAKVSYLCWMTNLKEVTKS